MMTHSIKSSRPARQPAKSLEEQVAHIGALSIVELRQRWNENYDSDPPASFSKDMIARAIAYRIQERAYGGLSASTARLLKSLAKPDAETPRRVMVGSVIVREHKGVLHEVMVVPGGFCWRGETYDSLSNIARKITGVSWNGPRFFGLRSRKGSDPGSEPCEATEATSPSKDAEAPSKQAKKGISRKEGSSRRTGRRSSIRTGACG